MAHYSSENTTVSFSEQIKGMTISHLLSNSLTFSMNCSIDSIGILFYVDSLFYKLKLEITQTNVVLTRNKHAIQIPIDKSSSGFQILLAFNPIKMDLYVISLYQDQSYKEKGDSVDTSTILVPIEVISWAKKLNLTPKTQYENTNELLTTILNDISQVNLKIKDTNAYTLFWNKIKDNISPKREPDSVTGLYAFLQDYSLIKNYELVHETSASSGSVDLYVIASDKNGKLLKLCIEVKNAHSDDIEHGLTAQLPEYMRSKSADYGIYLVFSYKCDQFEKPEKDISILKLELTRLNKIGNISIETFDLSMPLPPSHKKFEYK